MKKLHFLISKFFACALIVMLLSSCCSNLYYVTDPVVFGHVSQKSDFNLAGGVNLSSTTRGVHLSSSLAVSSKLFLVGSFTNYLGSCITTVNGNTTSSVKYSGRSFLGGIGYYKAIDNSLYFEGQIGGKYGNLANAGSGNNFEYRHVKYYLQPGLTYASESFQGGFALRFGIMDYLPYKTGWNTTIPEIATQGLMPYVDPSFYMSIGGKDLKIGAQISLTFADNSDILFIPLSLKDDMVSSDNLSLLFFLKLAITSEKTDRL